MSAIYTGRREVPGIDEYGVVRHVESFQLIKNLRDKPPRCKNGGMDYEASL